MSEENVAAVNAAFDALARRGPQWAVCRPHLCLPVPRDGRHGSACQGTD
jgi:hypothetical protein